MEAQLGERTKNPRPLKVSHNLLISRRLDHVNFPEIHFYDMFYDL
jgi:hypothetical protein